MKLLHFITTIVATGAEISIKCSLKVLHCSLWTPRCGKASLVLKLTLYSGYNITEKKVGKFRNCSQTSPITQAHHHCNLNDSSEPQKRNYFITFTPPTGSCAHFCVYRTWNSSACGSHLKCEGGKAARGTVSSLWFMLYRRGNRNVLSTVRPNCILKVCRLKIRGFLTGSRCAGEKKEAR